MATCIKVYLDIDGNKSSVYYNTLKETNNPQAAERAYIEYMMSVNPKFSREGSVITHINDVKKEGDALKLTADESQYTDGYDNFDRITSVVEGYKVKPDAGGHNLLKAEKFDPETISRNLAENDQLAVIFKGKDNIPHDEQRTIRTELAKYQQANPTDLERRAAEYRMSWEGSRVWGDHFHYMFQRFFEKRNTELGKEESKRMNDGQIFYKVKEELRKEGKWPKDNKIKSHQYISIVYTVLDEIKSIEKEMGSNLTIIPELMLKSSKLKFAGTADVVLISDEGEVVIMDFKSKTPSSNHTFDTVRGNEKRFGGKFAGEDLVANPANSARVQMSHYATILKEKGFKVSPREGVRTIVLTGNYGPVSNDANSASTQPWSFKSIKIEKKNGKVTGIRRNDSLHELLVTDPDAYSQETENMKAEGIFSFMNKVATPDVRAGMEGTEPVESILSYTRHNEEAAVKAQLENVQIEEGTGARFIYRNNPNLPNFTKEYLDKDTEENIKEKLRNDYKALKKDQETLPNKMIEFFKAEGADKKHNLPGREVVANAVLHGIAPETHRLMRAEQYDESLRELGRDVLVAENKTTGAISLISVISAPNNYINFPNDGSGRRRTTVFGRYASDGVVVGDGAGSDLLGQGKMHEFLGMKLGYAAMLLKSKRTKPLLIENMKIATIAGPRNAYVTPTFISKEISKFNRLLKYMPENEIPDNVKKIVANPSLQRESSYGYSQLEQLKKIFDSEKKLVGGYHSNSALEAGVKKDLEDWKQGEVIPYELKRKLGKFRREVIEYKTAKLGEKGAQADPDVQMLNRVITEIAGFNPLSTQMINNEFRKKTLRTAMTSMDKVREHAQVIYNNAVSRIKEDFEKFDRNHKVLLENFMREAQQQGIGKETAAYESIMVDPRFTQTSNPENFMKLKDPSELTNRPAAKAYVEFINSTIDAQYKKILTPKEYDKFKRGETWTKGHIPIIRSTKALTDRKTYESGKNLVNAIQHNVRAMAKKHYDPHMAFGFGYEHAKNYKEQLGTEGVQHSRSRKELLGMIGNNESNPHRDIEQNLALIMNNMVTTVSEDEHMTYLIEASEAVIEVLKEVDETNPLFDTKDTISTLDNWIKMVVMNEYGKEKGEEVKVLDIVGRVASLGMFSGSFKQAMTEAFTGTVQSTSSLIANSFLHLVDKDVSRFTPRDFLWGLNAVKGAYGIDSESMVQKILWDHGMLHADTAQIKQKEFASTSKWQLFKSRPLMYFNQLAFNSSVGVTFLAEIHNKGIHKAYEPEVYQGKTRFKYNETKDPRFYVYDESNPGFGHSVPPATTEDKKKHALWLAVRNEMKSEGSLDEDGKMKLPMTAKERTSIKYYATKLYGSFHKDKEIDEVSSSVVRAMTRYKAWFVQKAANYWTASDESESRGKWKFIEDATAPNGGFMQWEGMQHEGIIQSLNRVMKELYETRSLSAVTDLNDVQKENFAKLLADMLLLSLMMILLMEWLNKSDDAFSKSATGKSLKRAMTNSMSDLNVVATMVSMGETSMPAVDIAINSFKNIVNIPFSLMKGDTDVAWEKTRATTDIFGLVITGKVVAEAITGIDDK